MSKPAIIQYIENNFGNIDCDTLENAGYAFYQAAFASLFSAQWVLTAGFGGIAGAIEFTYALNGCNGPLPAPPDPVESGGEWAGEYAQSCECITRVTIEIASKDVDNWSETIFIGNYRGFQPGQFSYEYELTGNLVSFDVSWTGYSSLADCNSGTGGSQTYINDVFNPSLDLEPRYRAHAQYITCDFPPVPIPPTPPTPPGPIGPDTEFEDGECTWTITPTQAYVDNQGSVHTYYEVVPSAPSCGDAFGYWSDSCCPDFVSPPAPPTPPPGINECVEPDLGGVKYTLTGICQPVATGEPQPVYEWDIPAQKAFAGLSQRVDSIALMLQKHLELKTPICGPDRPELLGDWVTVRFESLENSPQGTRPLRKLFRYRSQSALDLGQKAAYWESFTWNAGPVCVQHKGSWWGTPQCWAENADEGKRVIRFAGLEAGLDPDAYGEWVISGSADPRFGMPGTMQVAKVQGLEWITSRQGPSGLPVLTVDP